MVVVDRVGACVAECAAVDPHPTATSATRAAAATAAPMTGMLRRDWLIGRIGRWSDRLIPTTAQYRSGYRLRPAGSAGVR